MSHRMFRLLDLRLSHLLCLTFGTPGDLNGENISDNCYFQIIVDIKTSLLPNQSLNIVDYIHIIK